MPNIQQSNTPTIQHSVPSIHIIGIGGTGMNGVAQLAAHAGYQVSGSDRATGLPIFQTLENLGIRIVPQDGSGITADTDFVVYSTAIESDNPDIVKAKELNIPLLHRADMLAKLCEGKEVIAVAGTAGKSTVTGLLGWIFQCLELDPTVYCGAPVLNWQQSGSGIPAAGQRLEASSTLGNVRYGKTGPWIIEADESDKSFLKFHPKHAIITNIAEDHFSLDELHTLFAQFESQVSGVVVKNAEPFDVKIPMLGKHNIENVDHALTLCKALGLDMQKCIKAVQSFKGIERRLERHGPKVIDDFAHSPIKIAAALEAVSNEFPAFSAYWRPHGYTPLFQGLEGFVDVFSNAWKAPREGTRPTVDCRPGAPTGRLEKLFILPIYFAGGTVSIKVTAEQFVERLQAAGVPAEFVESFQTLEKRLLEEGLPVLGMGARDPELPLFARRLASKLK
ncbi:MAG: Mur ligase domain-containing protein [Kiritimatiellales bacterium]